MKLTPPVHAVTLKHAKYSGRIIWDASGKKIHVAIEIAVRKKKKANALGKLYVKTESGMEFFGNVDGISIGEPEKKNYSPMKITTVSFDLDHNDFQVNYYDPSFPSAMRDKINEVFAEQPVLTREIDRILSH